MFKFINDRFKAFSLPVALVTLTLVCFIFALIASTAAFYWFNGSLPPNLIKVVAATSIIAATPLILQSMPTIKYLQNSRERLKATTNELETRVAELKTAYQELDIARAELEQRVEERTHEVNEARREAEEANQAKSDFLAKMSHELRTPLNAVIGFSELLAHPDALAPQKKLENLEDYAGTIHRSGKHLLSLVNDLLDLSKIEAGELKLYPEDIELGPFVEDIRDLVAVNADSRGHTLHIANKAADGILNADRRAMKQILLNLLCNAIKYSPDGAAITLTVEQQDNAMAFMVTDEGYGMTPHDLQNALKPFSRIPNAEVADIGGTGLGLPIVVSLVEAHGGVLDIQSAVGKGTTVTASFPPTADFSVLEDDEKTSAVA